MSPRSAASSSLRGALLLGAVALLGGCKGSAQSLGVSASASAGSNQQNLSWGGPGASGAQKRTDRPPVVRSVEDVDLFQERIFTTTRASGALLRFREELQSDGAGQLRLDVTGVWDETTQAWIPPHPLLIALYAQRTSFLVKVRDLHLRSRGLLSNYRWEPQPGTTLVDGRTCMTTRAHSLRGHGPIDMVHELGSGLLLGWTVWDASGTTVLQSLSTTTLELDPNQASVVWVDDRLPEEPYDSNVHDGLLHLTPRALLYPPAGFYRDRAVVMDLRGGGSPADFVHVEYWHDGLRTLSVMQHELTSGGSAGAPLSVARLCAEGGIVAVESDAANRRIVAVGLLPEDDVLMVVGALHE